MIIVISGDGTNSERIINLEYMNFVYFDEYEHRANVRFKTGETLHLSRKQFDELLEIVGSLGEEHNKLNI